MARRTTALVLCLGTASRMKPLSLTCPKVLLPFCGQPLLEYTLEQLRKFRIRKVVLISGLYDNGFEDFELWGRSDGMEIRVVRCGLEFGSAGVVKHVVEIIGLPDEQFLVIYGDSLFRIDLASLLDAHESKQRIGCKVTIAYHVPGDLVIKDRERTNYGIVWLGFDDRIERFVEKPLVTELSSSFANSGFFVINREVLDLIPVRRPLDFSTGVFGEMAIGSESPVFGFEVRDGYRFDIGTIRDYVSRQFEVLDGVISVDGVPWRKDHHAGNPTLTCFSDGKLLSGFDCKFGKGVRLRGNNIIGDEVSIGDGALLENCVILSRTVIAPAAKIANAVIGRSCRILENVVLHEGTVLGDFSVVA